MNITIESVLKDQLPDPYRDRVFWYAHHIDIKTDQINIYIDSKQCLVAFADLAKQLQLPSVEQLSHQGDALTHILSEHKPVLVSSGSFLWINDSLVVTRRNADTSFDPLHWTTPAGRCDVLPVQTAYKETAEEIHGFTTQNDHLWMPEPTLAYLNCDTAQSYPVRHCFPEPFTAKISMATVRTWLDDTCLEQGEMWYYYSRAVNTLELRLPMLASLDAQSIHFQNAEFDSPAKLMTISELKGSKLVPALAQLIKQIDGSY